MKIKRILSFGLVLSLLMGTNIFAANPHYYNSIGSVDMDDDGVTEGVDKNRISQTFVSGGTIVDYAKTKYYDNETMGKEDSIITQDATKECTVYVSQASTFSVIIPKTIILNGDVNAADGNIGTYVVTAKGNIAANEIIAVEPEEEFELTQKNNKTKLKATVSQPTVGFMVKEYSGDWTEYVDDGYFIQLGCDDYVLKDIDDGNGGTKQVKEIVGTSTTGTIEVQDLTAGSWEGTFNFDIYLDLIPEVEYIDICF